MWPRYRNCHGWVVLGVRPIQGSEFGAADAALSRKISCQKAADVASIKKLPWMGSTWRTSHSGF